MRLALKQAAGEKVHKTAPLFRQRMQLRSQVQKSHRGIQREHEQNRALQFVGADVLGVERLGAEAGLSRGPGELPIKELRSLGRGEPIETGRLSWPAAADRLGNGTACCISGLNVLSESYSG